MPKQSWTVAAETELQRQIEKDTDSGPQREKKQELLPKDYYDAVLTDVTARESRAGDPQIVLEFEVEGRKLARFPTFSVNGYEYAARDIINTGVDPSSLPDYDVDDAAGAVTVDTDTIVDKIREQCLGGSYRVGVEVSEYNGQNRNGIYWFRHEGGNGGGDSKSEEFPF